MSLLLAQLEQLKINQTLVDLYRAYDHDHPILGVVNDYNEDFVYLVTISEQGLQSGISIIQTDAITYIKWEGNTNHAIATLMAQKQTTIVAPNFDLSSWPAIINSVQFRYNYVTLQTEAMDETLLFIGQVEDIDEDFILMNEHGTLASPKPRKLLLDLEEITRVTADTDYEKDIAYLSKE